MAIYHNRKLFFFYSNSSSSLSSSSSSSCSDFCDPSCSNFDDCYHFPDPPDSLPPLPAPPPLPPTPPLPPAVEQVYQLSPIVVIVVVIVATIFLLVSCCAFVLKCFTSCTQFLTQRGNPNPSQTGPQHESDNLFGEVDDQDHPVVDHPIWFISTAGLQQSVINSITVVRYKSGDGLIEGTDCSVCLGEFQESETLRLLPKCNHAFHIDCIDRWLRSHTNCPLCRAGIVVNTDPSGPGLDPNERGLGHLRRIELTQMQDSDSSDVELGRSQTGDGSGVVENRGSDDHHEVDNDDQNKADDEIANNHSGNGIEGRLVLERRSFSSQFFPGSNSSPFESMGSCSSWRPQEARPGSRLGLGPIKRSHSWSERVFGSTNYQKCSSRFSP